MGHGLGFPAPEQPIKSCPGLSGEQIPLHSPGSWGCKPGQGKTSQESFLTIFISEGQGAEPARLRGRSTVGCAVVPKLDVSYIIL